VVDRADAIACVKRVVGFADAPDYKVVLEGSSDGLKISAERGYSEVLPGVITGAIARTWINGGYLAKAIAAGGGLVTIEFQSPEKVIRVGGGELIMPYRPLKGVENVRPAGAV
jgi:hypothetical protein